MFKYRYGNFTIFSFGPIDDPGSLTQALLSALDSKELGRGNVKFLSLLGKNVALKKYAHGGIFRALLSDLYLSEKRLLSEARILEYLRERGIICPRFLVGLVEESRVFKRLFLITERLDGFRPLFDVLKDSRGITRLKHLYRLANLFSQLTQLGLYHPDFHLKNLLSGPRGLLAVIDLDRARIKFLKSSEVKKMVLRLLRYIEKMEHRGVISLSHGEKLFLLRALKRSTNLSFTESLMKNLRLRRLWYKISWSLESLIYGGRL